VPYQVRLANSDDAQQLQEILLASDMDLISAIDDHVVITDDRGICGGGLIFQMDENDFHLLTLAVRRDDRSRGIGGMLMKEILNTPWGCCKDAIFNAALPYRVTTVARGSSRGFYLKHGMTDCDFSELVAPFIDQCVACPDVAGCNSAAMTFSGRMQ